MRDRLAAECERDGRRGHVRDRAAARRQIRIEGADDGARHERRNRRDDGPRPERRAIGDVDAEYIVCRAAGSALDPIDGCAKNDRLARQRLDQSVNQLAQAAGQGAEDPVGIWDWGFAPRQARGTLSLSKGGV